MENVVITGGNGFIGSHMCKLLHQKNYQVHIIDNHSTSPKEHVHSYGTFHHLDIADKPKVQELFNKLKPVAIFHFAARAYVYESEANPLLYYNENLVKTIALLESAIICGIKKFVFSSTCATFGGEGTENLHESMPQIPASTYGRTKLLMEMVMRDFASKGLIDVIVFRYFNAAGCSPEGELGENHIPETHLIPSIMHSKLSGGKQEFNIFGDQFPTPDGTCIRDYIHVNDLVAAHYDGLLYLQKNSGFHDFNLGSEKGSSVREVFNAFKKITGEELPYSIKPPRAGDPPRLVGDSKKAREILNFKPKYSLEDSIAHAWKYYSEKAKK